MSSNTNTKRKASAVANEQDGSKVAKRASNDKSSSNSKTNSSKKDEKVEAIKDGYESLSLDDIRVRILQLCVRVPTVPDGGMDPEDTDQIKAWATQLQAVVEEFNLLLCCISAATYKWGSDRSGAADQNLSILSNELSNSQDQISSTVTPRLTNVLAPVVDLVIEKTITTKTKMTGEEKEEEVKQNYFTREQVDPAFLKLCGGILCRNATLLRQVVLANFHKIDQCIEDFLKAQKKDSQHDSRDFAY